jgi:hypothetical protein
MLGILEFVILFSSNARVDLCWSASILRRIGSSGGSFGRSASLLSRWLAVCSGRLCRPAALLRRLDGSLLLLLVNVVYCVLDR